MLHAGGGGDGVDAATTPAGWARALMIILFLSNNNDRAVQNVSFLIGVRATLMCEPKSNALYVYS